ncbi:PAAR domain-containing protein [Cupriavidus agavae]|uniref:PAAR motif-containing protein n=1 Tax=Cupriavidus agavae TaxID=1001822 RepID=A0A4Q7S9B4_9BURK|nr:PAAR domain-containing protein [Cupriavidus agavae]RZT42042.1 PAAR motif-containing protein [Cupriavidus agavae]
MIRCNLLMGDRSTAGGRVIEGLPECTIMGTEMTFVGAKVVCPACKSTGVIIGVGPRFDNSWMGKTEALDGDICACRCEPAPVMIASQNQMFHRFEAEDLAAMGFDTRGRPLSRSGTPESPGINGFRTASQREARTETIEIVISDSRAISAGSQFGHSAFLIDGMEYGRAPRSWDKDTRERYLHRQQVKMARDSWGFEIGVTPAEKAAVLREIERRMTANEPYSLANNSCSSNIVDVLAAAGIQVHDPRWSFMEIVSPADLMAGLRRSKRLVRAHAYPKK